ncbi:hypothetical protein [Bacteroidetes bacterium endosymbiont of Geopemphigus sp.]|nr:hypothetical protein [Bacteroidetes bacterium endosymbiont of Geopemphigus sp.]
MEKKRLKELCSLRSPQISGSALTINKILKFPFAVIGNEIIRMGTGLGH